MSQVRGKRRIDFFFLKKISDTNMDNNALAYFLSLYLSNMDNHLHRSIIPCKREKRKRKIILLRYEGLKFK